MPACTAPGMRYTIAHECLPPHPNSDFLRSIQVVVESNVDTWTVADSFRLLGERGWGFCCLTQCIVRSRMDLAAGASTLRTTCSLGLRLLCGPLRRVRSFMWRRLTVSLRWT